MNESRYRNDGRLDDVEDPDVRSRRLQLIVYSSLVAFVVLAVYGFWLITSLTRDVSRLAVEMSSMTRTIEREMTVMAVKMGHIDERMATISDNMIEMNQNVAVMTRDVGRMNASMRSMTTDIATMAGSTLNMQRDMWSLNRNVSGPLGMMNAFNPFGGNMGPFPGSPAPFVPQHAVR